MKKSRFTEAQMGSVLREANRDPVAEVARRHGGGESRQSTHGGSVLARWMWGAPRVLGSDNGLEFISRALLRWAVGQSLDMALIDPGKPWQNVTTESFNGKFRDECLSMEWFRNRMEAKTVIEQWRQHYNEIRPHSSLGNQTPNAFRRQLVATTQPEAVLQL